MYMYVAIRRPRAHHARACVQNDTVKIFSIDHVLNLNVAHQITHCATEAELFEAQADLEETRNRRGRGSFCSNAATFYMIHISDVL